MKCIALECEKEANYQVGFITRPQDGAPEIVCRFDIDMHLCLEHSEVVDIDMFTNDEETWAKIDSVVRGRRTWHPDKHLTTLVLTRHNRAERRAADRERSASRTSASRESARAQGGVGASRESRESGGKIN